MFFMSLWVSCSCFAEQQESDVPFTGSLAIVRNQHTAPNSSKTYFSSRRLFQQQQSMWIATNRSNMGQRGQYFMTRRCPCVEISLELKKMTLLQNPLFMKSPLMCFNTEKPGVGGGLWWCLCSLV